MVKVPDPSAYEAILLRLISKELLRIAGEFPHVSFYGFALDTNITYGDVYISLNSREALREHCLKHYANRATEAEANLKWQFGDWSYRCVNKCSEDWNEGWSEYGNEIQTLASSLSDEDKDDEWIDWQERFMQVACRVLIKLQRGGAFKLLRLDSDFRVLCADHDEAVEDGEKRMEIVVRDMGS